MASTTQATHMELVAEALAVYKAGGVTTEAQEKAAMLAQAAPDLLEALERIVNCFADADDAEDHDLREEFQFAEYAIIKARGEQVPA